MNSNCKCSMSVIKKQCPRKQFPCSRCGAKIVNAGLQWEARVPKYKQWFYMDPVSLAEQPAAGATPLTVYAPRVLPTNGIDTPCRFDGPQVVESFDIVSGDTPASGGQFVQDFEWEPYVVEGWNFFDRGHDILVAWEEADVEEFSGALITPGRWSITLTIWQAAVAYNGAEVGTPIWQNFAPGGEHFDRFSGAPGDGGYSDISRIQATYYPPDGFSCLSLDTTRWTRAVPTLPILVNTSYTFATLPAGYQWPTGLPTEVDGIPVNTDGPFYPDGFVQNNNAYYAPPYIDVRHIPK